MTGTLDLTCAVLEHWSSSVIPALRSFEIYSVTIADFTSNISLIVQYTKYIKIDMREYWLTSIY